MAGDLAVAAVQPADPILWERAAYLHPATAAWPDLVRRQLADQCGRKSLVFGENGAAPVSAATGGEAALWANVGQWRLQREEPQAALVALKRSESLSPDPSIRSRLQLLQAKALVRLGQTLATTAILVQAASGTDPRLARPAWRSWVPRGCGRAAPSKACSCSAGRWKRSRLCSGPSVPRRKRIWAWLIFCWEMRPPACAGCTRPQETFEATGQYERCSSHSKTNWPTWNGLRTRSGFNWASAAGQAHHLLISRRPRHCAAQRQSTSVPNSNSSLQEFVTMAMLGWLE